jgi:hypothetical protein
MSRKTKAPAKKNDAKRHRVLVRDVVEGDDRWVELQVHTTGAGVETLSIVDGTLRIKVVGGKIARMRI